MARVTMVIGGVAVGLLAPLIGTRATAAAAAASSWSVISSPNAGGPQSQYDQLLSVTCVRTDDCWAVGYSYGGGGYQTLIEQETGVGWAIVSSPPTPGDALYGVTCVSANDCWAVGNSTGYESLTEHYDGTAWSIVSSPNPTDFHFNPLASVTCVSASDCWAVGVSYVGLSPPGGLPQPGPPPGTPLIEHYDGTAWSIVLGAPVFNVSLELLSVTCVSASNCWTVGREVGGTVIEHYNGTLWSLEPTGFVPDGYLASVTCASVSDCWAVGFQVGPLIEHYDGIAWAMVSTPNTASQPDILAGVTCVSTSDCWAVGYAGGFNNYNSEPSDQTLIEHDTGSGWAIVSSPNATGTKGSDLFGVACVSGSDCWAVGGSATGNPAAQTLIEQYGSTPPPANVPDLPWPPLACFAPMVGVAAVRARPLFRATAL